MKILHVIPSVATVRGGPSQAVLEMVRAIRDEGIDAEIVTTNDNGSDLLDVPLGQRIEYQQVPVWLFPRFSPNIHAVREFAFSYELTVWLWQRMHQYDLIHIHAIFSYASTIAMTIARAKKIPYIVRPLGQLCEWSLQQSARKKQIYLKLIERANVNNCQFLHFTSLQEQKEATQLNLNCPSFIVPHGLKFSPLIKDAKQHLRKKLNIPSDEPIILFLSRLHPKKGLDYLIPALGKFNYPFHFVLAGNGSAEYQAEIESLLISHGIRERTHLVGFVKGKTKDLFMQGADLFALTSYSENFGVAVLEALSAGLPTLLTSGVALSSLVKEHKLGYVTEQDVLAIHDALEEFFNHPNTAESMGERARKLILEEYTWKHNSTRLIEIYQQILS
ncbi:glycosyl transferase family 1 [Calothrix sp. HK-06]|nr:glycosyl transferase family 1 [Calothrix sp. HK-06]